MIEAEQIELADTPILPRRVLVAEDSPVTQDLLKLILTQRGHSVDIAEDGEEALSALQQQAYDVALIDFRLPKLDGLQVAQRYRHGDHGAARAHLIAITADIEGLLSHPENCENFDQIVPKPLDIHEVCDLIERTALTENAGDNGTPPHDYPGTQGDAQQTDRRSGRIALISGRGDPSWALGLELLRWPEDFDESRFSAGALHAFKGVDEIDAILIRRPAKALNLAGIWQRKPLHLFPIIDLDGSLGPHADFDASLGRQGDGDAVRALVQGFHRRRAQLHRDLLTTSDLGEKLLARAYVQDKPLSASYAADAVSLVRFNAALGDDELIREAEKHCKNGFMTRDFFDRFHVCYRCSSSRLHIREECPACRSSELREDAYVHHFKCGYQSVEADFRRGDRLICPKCRQELSHFSVDYDKPGTAIQCGRCSHSGSEPAIGFVCMDCMAHFDSDKAGVRDVYSYQLTEAGIAFLQMGQALRGPGQRTVRFSDLPLEFVIALNAAAKLFNESETPFTVVNLSYENEREIIREAGPRQFAQARDLFLENLTNELSDSGAIVKGHGYDFCLLRGMLPSQADGVIREAAKTASVNLRLDLGARVQLFGPEDFA